MIVIVVEMLVVKTYRVVNLYSELKAISISRLSSCSTLYYLLTT